MIEVVNRQRKLPLDCVRWQAFARKALLVMPVEAGGVTIATLARLAAEGVVRPDERVVAYVTGQGLKTLEAVSAGAEPTATIPPTLDAFAAAFDGEED